MKITLTKFDILRILVKHFGISEYHTKDESIGHPKFELHYDEIYWEGNTKPGIAGVKEILVCKKNKEE